MFSQFFEVEWIWGAGYDPVLTQDLLLSASGIPLLSHSSFSRSWRLGAKFSPLLSLESSKSCFLDPPKRRSVSLAGGT